MKVACAAHQPEDYHGQPRGSLGFRTSESFLTPHTVLMPGTHSRIQVLYSVAPFFWGVGGDITLYGMSATLRRSVGNDPGFYIKLWLQSLHSQAQIVALHPSCTVYSCESLGSEISMIPIAEVYSRLGVEMTSSGLRDSKNDNDDSNSSFAVVFFCNNRNSNRLYASITGTDSHSYY